MQVILLIIGISLVAQANGASNIEDKDYLYVHVIPHSHCDPGWLKTYKEYYHQNVGPILTNIYNQIKNDPTKTFNWAEISFFSLWWEEQSLEVKEKMKEMVSKGQFEFIGGGVVQNDEAASSLDVIINQVTDGHEYLLKHFGVRPRIAWQVDPFGHSTLTPTLFAQMGYEAMVINRIHHQLKSAYKDNKKKMMEFVWQPSASLEDKVQMFTHVLHTHYSAIQGFDWEEGVPYVSERNVADRANEYARKCKERASSYRTNRLLVPWGDDFKFYAAGTQFENMDQIVKYINEHSDQLKVKIQYSTLSRYFDEVNYIAAKKNIKFPFYQRDFFPYADNEDSYWTGYYTSRPLIKAYHRDALSMLRSAEMVHALARSEATAAFTTNKDWEESSNSLLAARWHTDLVAHHDGITGTARSRVVSDYLGMLDTAFSNSENVLASMSEVLLSKDQNQPEFDSEPKELFELESKGGCFPLVYQNSLGWERNQFVNIRVDTQSVHIRDGNNKEIPSQVHPVWERDASNALKSESELNRFDVYFLATVPPLGLQTYFVCKSEKSQNSAILASYQIYSKSSVPQQRDTKKLNEQSGAFIENKYYRLNFNGDGEISSIVDRISGTTRKLEVEHAEYNTYRSGAYIFRSEGRDAAKVDTSQNRLHIITGDLVQEAQLYFSSGAKNTLRIRLYNTEAAMTSDTSVGEDKELSKVIEVTHISAPSSTNRELVVRFSTDLDNQGNFWTDNGIEMIPRRFSSGKREANYYPVQSTAFIQDTTKNEQFTVLLKQVFGCSMNAPGSFEFMIHRNLGQDDGRGLSERVDDFTQVRSQNWLIFEEIQETEGRRQKLSLMLEHPLRRTNGKFAIQSASEWLDLYAAQYAPIVSPFPKNVHVMSLKTRDPNSDELILRLAHVFEANLHMFLSREVSVDLNSHFSSNMLTVTSLSPITISAASRASRPSFPFDPQDRLLMIGDQQLVNFTRSPGARQNSDEDGVFLSKDALENAKKLKEKLAAEQKQREQQQQGANKRQLLSLEPLEMMVNPITLNPLEIQSFLINLEPSKQYYKALSQKYPEVDNVALVKGANKAPTPNNNKPKPTKSSPTPAHKDSSKNQKFNSANEKNNINPNDNNPDDALFANYMTNNEMRALLVLTTLGVALIMLTYVQLQRRRRREKALLPR